VISIAVSAMLHFPGRNGQDLGRRVIDPMFINPYPHAAKICNGKKVSPFIYS
jgi:hypothetical protein